MFSHVISVLIRYTIGFVGADFLEKSSKVNDTTSPDLVMTVESTASGGTVNVKPSGLHGKKINEKKNHYVKAGRILSG